jgi:16S rRNA (guanine527-N7)-methyltransferase
MLDFSVRYLHLLKTRFAGLNLTRILDDQEFYEKQVLDSILPYEQSTEFKEALDRTGVMVDIGFGGGFPLLPMAFHAPKAKYCGFESRGKKVDAVNEIAQELKLSNAKAFHNRAEEVLLDQPCVVTFKAVGTVMDYLPSLRVGTKDITVFFYKGPSYMEKEQPEFEKKLAPQWDLFVNQLLKVPGTEERRLVGFKPKNVPRGTGKILVKLSDIL